MMKRVGAGLVALAMIGGAAKAAAQNEPAAYSVKPSDVVVPLGEALGAYRRMIEPFKNWILICDESLKSKRRICNLTQSIVSAQGAVVFNWSVIATEKGKPLMILRVPAAVGVGQKIVLGLGAKPDLIAAPTDRCDANFCFATIAIGDMLKRHIHQGTVCSVTYPLSPNEAIAFQAPLDGLYGALMAMK